MKSMAMSDIAYQHHRDLNDMFGRHKYLMQDVILQGTYQLDYLDDMSGAVVVLEASGSDEDPRHAKRVRALISRLEKDFKRYFKQQNMRCEIKLVFTQAQAIGFSAESARLLKAKLSALKLYQGKFETIPIDPRYVLKEGLDRLTQLRDPGAIEAQRRDLHLSMFSCLMPAIRSVSQRYPHFAECSGMIDNLIDFRELIAIHGMKHMRACTNFRARTQNKVAETLVEFVQDDVLAVPKLRAEVKIQLSQLPYNNEALERVNQWVILIKELLPLLQSLKELADEVFEFAIIYEIAIFNADIMFDPDLEQYWREALCTTYQPEYDAFIVKGYAQMGSMKASYQRYKICYSVLHAQLEKLCKAMELFQQRALRHHSAFFSCMRQIRRLQAQQTVTPMPLVTVPTETSNLMAQRFWGPSNLTATKESKQHAASLAAQSERKRQATSLETLSHAVTETPPAATTWVQVEVLGVDSVRFDLATGLNAQGELVAIRVAPALQYPVYITLLGLLELSPQETQNLLQQQGREFLMKTGHGANGLKRFGDNMLGLKALKDAGRLVLVGMPLPLGQGWCYVPTCRVSHAQWEALQPDHPTNYYSWQQLRDTMTTQTTLTLLGDVAPPRTGLAL